MKNKTLVIILHSIVMLLAYTSPFWLDWKLMIVGIAIYYLQIWILGGCVLTYAQYGKWNETFSGRSIVWLGRIFGMRFELRSVKRFLDFLPAIYVIFALIYQVLLHGPVLLNIKLWGI